MTHGTGVTISVVLVLIAAAAVLTGGIIRELHASRQEASAAARSSAVLLGEALMAEPTLGVSPGDTAAQNLETILDDGKPKGGAAYLVTPDLMLSAGNAIAYNPGWQTGAPSPGYRIAIRTLPGAATIITAAPAAPPVSVLLPYGAAALFLMLGAVVILRRLGRFAEEAEKLREDRDALLMRTQTFDKAGAGLWRLEKGLVALPAALRRELGYADQAVGVPVGELHIIFDDTSVNDAATFFQGKWTSGDIQLTMPNASGALRSAHFTYCADHNAAWGLCTLIGEERVRNDLTPQLTRRLNETLAAIPQAFLHWDESNVLVSWNDQFCSLFRIDGAKLEPGMMVDEVSAFSAIDPRFLRQHFAPSTPPRADEEVIFPGDRVIKIICKRTLGDGWLFIGQDVTEAKVEAEARARKERELQMTVHILEQSRKELSDLNQRYALERQRAEDANRAKTEFLANISHELRTPLNAINGFSAIMQSELYGPLGSEKYAEYVNDINDSGCHLLELIDEILDLSKVEAGKMELRLKPLDLEKLLAESIRVIEPQSRADNVHLHAAYDHLPSVFGDARAVKQVLLNLLSNATKFTEGGGRVTLTTVSDLDSVTVIIADTGQGIDADNLTRLGTPFVNFVSSQKRDKRGTGLGLALSKSLIDAMGGILCIASEKGRGTVAAFTLPRRHGVEVTLPEILSGKVHVLTASGGHGEATQRTATPSPMVAE
ncbi:MAG: ATP-binding protein [Pseudomonadota bacterium]